VGIRVSDILRKFLGRNYVSGLRTYLAMIVYCSIV